MDLCHFCVNEHGTVYIPPSYVEERRSLAESLRTWVSEAVTSAATQVLFFVLTISSLTVTFAYLKLVLMCNMEMLFFPVYKLRWTVPALPDSFRNQ